MVNPILAEWAGNYEEALKIYLERSQQEELSILERLLCLSNAARIASLTGNSEIIGEIKAAIVDLGEETPFIDWISKIVTGYQRVSRKIKAIALKTYKSGIIKYKIESGDLTLTIKGYIAGTVDLDKLQDRLKNEAIEHTVGDSALSFIYEDGICLISREGMILYYIPLKHETESDMITRIANTMTKISKLVEG